jgi:hypothetical protein
VTALCVSLVTYVRCVFDGIDEEGQRTVDQGRMAVQICNRYQMLREPLRESRRAEECRSSAESMRFRSVDRIGALIEAEMGHPSRLVCRAFPWPRER